MRGNEEKQMGMLALMNLEERVPGDHPLRKIKRLINPILKRMSPLFDEMYSKIGRPSIPPERLLSSSLLMALYSIRSERLFCEQLEYNLLFRWFLGMDGVEPAFDHSTFSANRERLMNHEVSMRFFQEVVLEARRLCLMSDEHFTVDGTLIESWASIKSFRPKRGNKDDEISPSSPGEPDVNFKGKRLRNATHASTTDPECRLARKSRGKGSSLCFSLHALTENHNGLLVDFRVGEANGTIEREMALKMLDESLPGTKRITLGADKGYNSKDFVRDCRERNVTPHIAHRTRRRGGSAIDLRTSRHPGYELSQRKRKLVEEVFGWSKTIAGFTRTRFIGIGRTQFWAYFVGGAYNLLRISRLAMESP